MTTGTNHPNFNNAAVAGPDTATGNGLVDAHRAVLVAKLRCISQPIVPLIHPADPPVLQPFPLPLSPIAPTIPIRPILPLLPILPLAPAPPLEPFLPFQPMQPLQPFHAAHAVRPVRRSCRFDPGPGPGPGP